MNYFELCGMSPKIVDLTPNGSPDPLDAVRFDALAPDYSAERLLSELSELASLLAEKVGQPAQFGARCGELGGRGGVAQGIFGGGQPRRIKPQRMGRSAARNDYRERRFECLEVGLGIN